ncbi:MAG: flavodoxin domain-containing protein, partial [Saprospiraceae bacterium]
MSNFRNAPTLSAGFDAELLQRLATQHSAMQQMWLSGYLYAVALHGQPAPTSLTEALPAAAFAPAPIVSQPKVTVLFGSQTGNSKKVAQQVAVRVRERGWEVTVADLNDYPTRQLKDEQL